MNHLWIDPNNVVVAAAILKMSLRRLPQEIARNLRKLENFTKLKNF
jgi:hypothetical protein